ncbi:MAG TPA: efflux RND transporter periplasmic adaptor subunit [Longimicrobiales bacterium]|nr:efflux RND transporter periplasmic adaptor subunit [Longimicrobiales bacterium]
MQKSRIKQFGTVAVVALAAVATIGFLLARDRTEPLTYRFVEVTRGSVESSVSATGKLSAVRTIQVGTQVSGQISAIFVDFNDRVTRGQVIARLDPTVLQQQVRQADVDMERVRADVAQKKYELDQATPLFDAKVITENEYNTAQYNYTVARTNLKSSQVSYDRAVQNLNYSTIYAPIDGIVVERNVEPGQTVAASMSTPQLFLLAEDLGNMQILVNVDESDIGSIREGMRTRFNVQAYPDRTFEGTVDQVRLQSAATENVVNYTVVVRVSNADGVLLPGMTATVTFEVQRVDDVLKVPAVALRFRPTEEMLAQVGLDSVSRRKTADSLRAAGAANRPATDDSRVAATQLDSAAGLPRRTGRGGAGGAGGGAGPGNTPGGRGAGSMLFYLTDDGRLAVVRVIPGITNGQETAVMGDGLRAGMQIIAGVTGGPAQESAAANPFNSQQQQPQRFGPRGAF